MMMASAAYAILDSRLRTSLRLRETARENFSGSWYRGFVLYCN